MNGTFILEGNEYGNDYKPFFATLKQTEQGFVEVCDANTSTIQTVVQAFYDDHMIDASVSDFVLESICEHDFFVSFQLATRFNVTKAKFLFSRAFHVSHEDA